MSRDLTEAIEAGAAALNGMTLPPSRIGINLDGLVLDLPTHDMARMVLEAAAELIVAATRREVAEEIARAIEVARGDRCPDCGGKAAFHRVDGARIGRGCGGGHVWSHPERPWLNYDPAAIARGRGETGGGQ